MRDFRELTPGERYQAAIALYHQDQFDENTIKLLIEAAGDDHPGVRTYARKALEKTGETGIVHIRRALLISDHINQIVTLLPLIATTDQIFTLTEHTVGAVRAAAMKAISKRSDEASVTYLIEALDDPLPEVQYYAVLGLARQNITEAPPALIDCLRSDSILLRGAASYALGKIGDPSAISPLLEALHLAIDDANIEPAVTAVAGQPMNNEEWRRFTAAHGTIDLPVIIAYALSWFGDESIEAANSLLQSEDFRRRQTGIWILGSMKKPLPDSDVNPRVEELMSQF